MIHLDICSISYGKKKRRESNCQFDSRPLKVRNQPNSGACRCSATHHWKALDESYNFSLEFISIGGLSKELSSHKVAGVQTMVILGLFFGSPGTKSHSDVSVAKRRKKYYMGEGGGFLQIWAVVSIVSPKLPVACPSTKGAPKSE
jgi:hypothetical protein